MMINMVDDQQVVSIHNELLLRSLRGAHPGFGIQIILDSVLVAVHMVRLNIEQYGYVRPKPVYIFELKAAKLHHIPFRGLLSQLAGEAVANVADQRYRISSIAEQCMDHSAGGGLAIA